MKLPKEHEELLAEFRSLPEPEREILLHKATELQMRALGEFMTALQETPGYTKAAKLKVMELFLGPLNQSEDEAVAEGSAFSRTYNLTLISSIIEVMKQKHEHEKQTKKEISENRDLSSRTSWRTIARPYFLPLQGRGR